MSTAIPTLGDKVVITHLGSKYESIIKTIQRRELAIQDGTTKHFLQWTGVHWKLYSGKEVIAILSPEQIVLVYRSFHEAFKDYSPTGHESVDRELLRLADIDSFRLLCATNHYMRELCGYEGSRNVIGLYRDRLNSYFVGLIERVPLLPFEYKYAYDFVSSRAYQNLLKHRSWKEAYNKVIDLLAKYVDDFNKESYSSNGVFTRLSTCINILQSNCHKFEHDHKQFNDRVSTPLDNIMKRRLLDARKAIEKLILNASSSVLTARQFNDRDTPFRRQFVHDLKSQAYLSPKHTELLRWLETLPDTFFFPE